MNYKAIVAMVCLSMVSVGHARAADSTPATATVSATVSGAAAISAPLVLMTDFGVKDGAVSEMKGVSYGISRNLLIADLTHEIAPGNIWEGAYRFYQSAPYWPQGSVFVGVIDPGVGTSRRSIVAHTKAGHYYVVPDNGLLTLIDETEHVDAVRIIDEKVNRLPGSEKSNTFHGRDVFGYTGARLASGRISFEQVGPAMAVDQMIRIAYQHPTRDGDAVKGMIPVLDIQFGNVWTNIPQSLFEQAGFKVGDRVKAEIFHDGKKVDTVVVPFVETFGDVPVSKPLVYINSLLNVSLALNQGSYAKTHHIGFGAGWSVRFSRL